MKSVAPNLSMTVYLAGPLSNPDPALREQNVALARAACRALWNLGVVPISTHTMWGDLWGEVNEADVAAACDCLLLQCDAVVLLEGWNSSFGSQRELALARRSGLPVFELDDFLGQQRCTADGDDSTGGT